MNRQLIFIIAGAFLALIVIGGATYTVQENEQAVITQFGKPVGDNITTAGLHFKLPFIQEVKIFDKWLLEWDGDPTEIPTRDGKYIFIDAFARWQITDPLKFYKNLRTENRAQSRLDDIVDGSVRDEVSGWVMTEIIRSTGRDMVTHDSATADPTMDMDSLEKSRIAQGARLEIIANILKTVSKKLVDLDMGIEVVDIQLKRQDYNQKVQQELFTRMISDQNRVAEKYRAQGQGEKQRIIGLTTQKKKQILSGAYLHAQIIRGAADAEAVKIYAQTYGQSTEFYKFTKALETYETALDSTTTFILSTDNKYLRYLESTK